MVRSFLLAFISFMFPVLLFGQEETKPEEDSTEKKDLSSFKNEVGLGAHLRLRYRWFHQDLEGYLIQGSYKRRLEHFTLRAGLGAGKNRIDDIMCFDKHCLKANHGRYTTLILNVGAEKTIWRVGQWFQMGIGLDLVHLNRWSKKYDAEFRGDGIGLSLMNGFSITPHSSISLELGYSYGKIGWGAKDRPLKWKERLLWDFVYRNFVLSYNYHF